MSRILGFVQGLEEKFVEGVVVVLVGKGGVCGFGDCGGRGFEEAAFQGFRGGAEAVGAEGGRSAREGVKGSEGGSAERGIGWEPVGAAEHGRGVEEEQRGQRGNGQGQDAAGAEAVGDRRWNGGWHGARTGSR